MGSWIKDYIYLNGELLATESATQGTRYHFSDHLGTPRVITDSAGTVISRHDYYPFGREVGVSTDGETHKFTGKERDVETGLYYFGARYYHETHGRLMTPDEFTGGPRDANGGSRGEPGPLPYAETTRPQSLNKYTYTYNNPLRYIDPNGHEVVLAGSKEDQEEAKRRVVQNASKKGEAALFKTVTDKNGKTNLVLDKDAAAKFHGKHSQGFNMLVQTINSKNAVTVQMDNFDSRTTFQGKNATVFLNRNVAAIDIIAPMRDAKGGIVPNPFNIIAGHEVLGHARLHLLGDPEAYADGPGSKTFKIENILRKEQGLPPRPDEAP